jgi:thiamine-monophosphate kinase
MGGRPLAAVLALEVPRGTRASTLDGLVDAFAAAARRHGAALVGGNVARGRQLGVVATLLGIAGPRLVTRAGARPGDAVFVTGTLGGTAAAVRARRAGRTVPLPRVPDRVRAGALVARVASAMIDVSDGLAQDVGHLCRASRVAAQLDAARIPIGAACRRLGRSALAAAVTGGEDYELCFTVPPSALARLAALEPRLGCRVTRIGRIERGRPRVRIVDAAGDPIPLARAGFDHFRA